MRRRFDRTLILLGLLLLTCSPATAQQHDHGHTHAATTVGSDEPVEKPRVFFDKSPRIVAYQLSRLDNTRLLLVERSPDDAKYMPAYVAILTRDGIAMQHRMEALSALVTMNQSTAVGELLSALQQIKLKDAKARRTADQLAGMLLSQPAEQLAAEAEPVQRATAAKSPFVRSVGYAGLIVAGKVERAWSSAKQGDTDSLVDWLHAIPLIPQTAARDALRENVIACLADSQPIAVRRAAVQSLAFIKTERDDAFARLAVLVNDTELQDAAVQTLLALETPTVKTTVASQMIGDLVNRAEATPAADRTSDTFVDAMQLADRWLAKIPPDDARTARRRLRAVAVRVIRIHTVEEAMRYDVPYFAAEAGRPIQIILQNEDLMPHNLVITQPGALQEVAQLGMQAGPNNGYEGKQYVPESQLVLHATPLVQPHTQARLTFEAPTEPGEYPYVCTFPNHWMRMYGVMVVVEDLDAWLSNPVEPKDPVGSNRPFVKSWQLSDLADQVAEGMRGRTSEIGKRIFTEATCAQCHKVAGEGGAVGPELTGVFTRWKGDTTAVLREILDPSHRIDPKYAMASVVTEQGDVITGIIQQQDAESVTVIADPESGKPTIIKRDKIDEIVPSSISMMPKGLLERFTQDEIFELVAYLQANPEQVHPQ